MMIILWYRKPLISNASPIPTPNAWIIATISLLANILSSRARSVLSTLPRSGKIACVLLSRPSFAEPAAELPSTIYTSLSDGFLLEQSHSLPGKPMPSSAPFRSTLSRAARAALRARAAKIALPTIFFATSGFSSR